MEKEIKNTVIAFGVTIICVVTTGYLVNYFYKRYQYYAIIKKKQDLLKKKKKDLYDKLLALKKLPTEINTIINMHVKDLLSNMESGILKPLDILQTYQIKALQMDEEFNFITDLNPNAEIDASNCMSKKGLLRGIPISVKDVFYLKDCDCTYGMPSYCFNPAAQDSSIIHSLRLQGAIPFVMTNLCQTGISIESSNPIFGQTLNPHNKKMTAGGSSGGEGAIIGSRASILGVGSDIGGSIRIPSSYCGIFGLKPTANRITRRHTAPLYADQNLINVSIGPMSRSFEDLLLLFRAMVSDDMYNLDPLCPPIGFNEQMYSESKPLRIGYYFNFGGIHVTPVPAVVRAVNIAKMALESAGHTLLECKIPDIDEAMFELYLKCMYTDGGYGFINKFIGSNPIDSSLFLTVILLKLPNFLKKMVSYAILPFNKNYSSGLYALSGVSSVYSLWELKEKLEKYREKVLSMWQKERLDGIICPVLPVTAPPCQTSAYIMDIISYTTIFNVLDYPAGSVPVTHVTKADIEDLEQSYPRDSPTHRQVVDLQKESMAMPVGVQCVAMQWQEEVCLRIMRDLASRLPS